MAVQTRTLHGTRSVLSAYLNRANDGSAVPLGIFESIEVSVSQDHFEPYILGRASPGEIVIMGQSPISVRLSGFRKVDQKLRFGPYGAQNLDMNTLQEILADNKDLTITVVDRQTSLTVLQVVGAKCVSHNLAIAAKQPARLNMELVGLTFSDEDGPQSELGVEY